MNASRRGALLLAAGRAALGAGILAAPGKITGHWLGEANAELPVVGDLARSLAIRDLALGLITLQTLDDPVVGPRVQFLCACADSVDALATIIARKHLPRTGVIGTVAIAGASAGVGFYFAHRLAHA
jgi:hypothetical protein